MFQLEFTPLLDVPSNINNDLKRFGRRNLWHGLFPKSFCTWVFNKHRKESWISKFSALCILALHKMWIERCSICHESTSSRIRIEDHETLQTNVENIFDTHETLPPELEIHRGKVESMTSELLRAFLYECYALT